MNEDKPRVMLGTPVRDMANVLPQYLQAIHDLDYPRNRILLNFIENNSLDKTPEILASWVLSRRKEYESVNVESRIIDNLPKNERHDWNRVRTSGPLARMRRDIFEAAIEAQVDYLALIDADILVPPHFLVRLMGHQKDVIAGLVKNTADSWDTTRSFNFLEYNEMADRYERENEPGVLLSGMRRVGLTGAAVIISKRAFTLCRPHAVDGKTDRGFADCCRSHGIEQWVDCDCPCNHLFRRR